MDFTYLYEIEKRERSKMTTKVQKQTAWAPWLKNFAERLQPHLTEIKHQGESKFQHHEHLPLESFSMPHYTEKTSGLLQPPANTVTTAKPTPPTTPGINQYSLQSDWPLCKKKIHNKKTWTMNNELKTSTQQKGRENWKHSREEGKGKKLISAWTISKQIAGKAGSLTVGRS
jgi:hypothetical protein